MLARTSPTLAAAALALAAAACTPDHIVSPAPQAISPEIRRLLESAETQTGPVAVMTPATGSRLGSPSLSVADQRGGIDAARQPGGPRRDMAESDLVFIANPSGGRAMGGADPTANATFTFYCFNGATGQWTQMMNVSVGGMRQRALPGTGGHRTGHSGTKPAGSWSPSTGNTAADGGYRSTYTAGVAAGDEELLLTYTSRDASSPCNGMTASKPFNNAVRYQGLSLVTARDGLTLTPISSDHVSIYYATSGTAEATYRAQRFYANLSNNTDHLRVNAISTIYGGINDVSNNWRPPHSTHRIGTDVDFDGVGDSQRVWDRVIVAGTRGGGFRRCEVHNRNHVHCYNRLY